MARTERILTSIPSDTTAGQQIQEQIVRLLEELEFSPRDVFSVRLALEEALVNAIKHGNQMHPDKQVHIDCQIDRECVKISIRDEGGGFDPRDVPDPTIDENLERPCGRGIMLMRSFMSFVEFNESGNEVVMEKRRSVDEPASA